MGFMQLPKIHLRMTWIKNEHASGLQSLVLEELRKPPSAGRNDGSAHRLIPNRLLRDTAETKGIP